MTTIFNYSAFLLADRVIRLFQDEAETHASYMYDRKVRQNDAAGAEEWHEIRAAVSVLRNGRARSLSRQNLWGWDEEEKKVLSFVRPVDNTARRA